VLRVIGEDPTVGAVDGDRAAVRHDPLRLGVTWPPLMIMTLVAVVFVWPGLNRFEHRDVQPG
jgi:hypothetical protein